MAGGASSTNMNDTYFGAMFEAYLLPALRPSMTSRNVVRWAPAGNALTHSFGLLGDAGPAGAMTEGTDFTTVTDITTSPATVTASEVGMLSTVSDVLIKVSLADAMSVTAEQLVLGVQEKWETDLAAIADNFGTATTAASTLTPADLAAAISAIEQRDAATGPLVAYLHPKQTGELRSEIQSTTAIRGAADGAGVPSGAVIGETNGRGFFGNLYDVDIYQTSLVASASSLRQGSVFVSGQAIGGYELWGTKVETERRASLRGFYVVASANYGVGSVEVTNRGQMLKSAA